MNPVQPPLHQDAHLVVYGSSQPEYLPLPASVDNAGLVMTEWEPTADELGALFKGGRVRLWIWKGNAHVCEKCDHQTEALMVPVSVDVAQPEPLADYSRTS